MKGISRYILWQILGTLAFVTIAVTSAIYLTQSLRLIDLIVNRGVSFSLFLYMTVLVLPGFLVIVLPIAVFTSVAFVYNRLTMESELVVMRATGLSQLSLAGPALLVAGAVTIFCYALTVYVMPLTYREFRNLELTVRNEYTSVLLQEGVFNTIGDGLTVFVRARLPDGELRGILVHDTRVPGRPITAMAESGAIVQTPEGPRVLMRNGNRQEVSKDTGRLSLLYFDRYALDVTSTQEAIDHRWLEPRERYLNELFWPSSGLDDVKNYGKLRAEGHQRLVSPLYALAFTCIALAFLLSGEFNRRGQSRVVLTATLTVIAVQALGLALNSFTARLPALTPFMYINAILPILAGLYCLVTPLRFGPRLRPAAQGADP